MSRRSTLPLLALAVALAASAVTAAAQARPDGAFTKRGTVSYVVDGDTLEVAVEGGGRERVRLIGIDTPERGTCYFAQASAQARRLALGRRIVLRGDASQDTRDRYGRLLAYVGLPDGTDLSFRLIDGGFGTPYVYRTPFQRLGGYRRAEQAARTGKRGLWAACGSGSTASSPGAKCHPSYSPCLPVVGDLDCADVRRLGKAPVRVTGTDPYRLDGDGDGWGCE